MNAQEKTILWKKLITSITIVLALFPFNYILIQLLRQLHSQSTNLYFESIIFYILLILISIKLIQYLLINIINIFKKIYPKRPPLPEIDYL